HLTTPVIFTLSLHDALPIYSRFGLHLESRNYRAGVDVRNGAMNIELRTLLHQNLRLLFELGFVDGVLLIWALQHRTWRKLEGSVDRKSTRLNSSHRTISYAV